MQVVEQPRKIVKAKKRLVEGDQRTEKLYDEDGNELEFEGDIIEEVEAEEDVVQRDDDDGDEGWEDDGAESGDEDEDMEGAKGTKKKEVWDESKAPLQDGEELVFDNSAYQMLHRAKVEWPCLSIDVLVRDRIGEGAHAQSSWFPQYVHGFDPKHSYKDRRGLQTHKKDKFPYTVYFCAGSQSLKKSENKIYVNKWSDMCRTLKDDQDIDSNEEDDEEEAKDPIMRFECIPHRGCVNRIRSLHGTGIVATWNDENDVGIYDVTQAVEALDAPVVPGKPKKQQSYGGTKLASFKHTDEGYALDWSPLTWGRLAAGCCNSQISLYIPADENCSSFIKEVSGGL